MRVGTLARRGRLLRTHVDDERGATLVIVTLCLIALFGMLVLVVDVGGLLWKRRELVNGSDAAALAAAKTCATDPLLDPQSPGTVADDWAAQNVGGTVTGGIVDSLGCDPRTPGGGFVTVRYSSDQSLFFAPVLGFGDSNGVTTEATAAWGSLGSGRAVPIVLESSQFQGPCDIPDNVDPGDECSFWYNNGPFAIGDSNWGFLNLDKWDVPLQRNVCSQSCLCTTWDINRLLGAHKTATPI